MKAWFVWAGEPYFDWGDYVHGETLGKAKSMFMKTWHGEVEWVSLYTPRRAIRLDDPESAAMSLIGANVSREYLHRLAELISI